MWQSASSYESAQSSWTSSARVWFVVRLIVRPPGPGICFIAMVLTSRCFHPVGVCREKVIDSDQRISKLGAMGKTFRAYDMNQQLLLPPDMREWLREDHLALYVSDVVESLDLSGITKVYDEGDLRGRPPYHPALMVKLLIYGYCVGKMSSR